MASNLLLSQARRFSMKTLAAPAALPRALLGGVRCPPQTLSIRSFARSPQGSRFSQPKNRPVQVLEREQEGTQQQRYQELQQQQQAGLRFEEEGKEASQQTGYDAVSSSAGLQSYLSQVYGTLGATAGIAGLGSVAMMMTPLGAIPAIVPALGGLVPVIWLSMFTSPHTHSAAFRGTLLGSFGFMSGMAMAPLLGMATAIDPMIVPSALAATTGMFGVMSGAALALPKGRLMSLGAPLFGGMIGLLGVGIVGAFTPPTSAWYPVLHSVSLYGGLGIFSIYIAYDTQLMIRDFEEGNKDQIRAALNMFINLKIIFQQMLMIFIGRSD